MLEGVKMRQVIEWIKKLKSLFVCKHKVFRVISPGYFNVHTHKWGDDLIECRRCGKAGTFNMDKRGCDWGETK
jgi:hypothetical protein